jgi:FAD/FMN-containing dehydrogenase
VLGLEAVLPDGEIIRTRVDDAGYDLTGLLVGSEGTLAVMTQMTLGLLPLPEEVETLLVTFSSMEAAAQTVTDVMTAGIIPATLELMDRVTVQAVEDFVHADYPRDAEAVLLIEVDGARERVAWEAEKVRGICRQNGCGEIRRAENERSRQKLWEGRRGAYPAMAKLAPNVLVEDGVVPRNRLPEAIRRIRAIATRENLRMGLIAHAGDGNLHPNMVFDERDAEETRRVKKAADEMLRVCVDMGGSISGEHGIGLLKRKAMGWLFTSDTLHLFRRIKEEFDPENLCNPDKLIPLSITPTPQKNKGFPKEFAQTLDQARSTKKPIFIRGLGTKNFAPPEGTPILDVSGFRGVVDHDRDNFTLTVKAGTILAEIQSLLEPVDQYVHMAGEGTVGGILSARSCRRPLLRNQVIGLKVLLSNGCQADLGGRVMKNVAGYDALKLFLGAWGTLGIILEVTLRLWPVPSKPIDIVTGPPDFSLFSSPLHQRIRKIFDPEGVFYA